MFIRVDHERKKKMQNYSRGLLENETQVFICVPEIIMMIMVVIVMNNKIISNNINKRHVCSDKYSALGNITSFCSEGEVLPACLRYCGGGQDMDGRERVRQAGGR